MTTGPMILGVVLLVGVMLLSEFFGTSQHDQELLRSMLVYALLASLVVTSFFTMITTRFTADMIFSDLRDAIMPSMYGSLGMMLSVGGLCFGVFLMFAGIPLSYQVLSFVFFLILITVWTEITYLTAIKDYRGILKAFAVSLFVSFLLGYILLAFTEIDDIIALFFSVIVGYSLLATWYFLLLYTYFPEGFGTSLNFLRWVKRYTSLTFVGAFVTFGLFGHLIIMWTSPIRVQIQGLYYGAPQYDVAALVAFFSILVTTINFIVSVEVRFYPLYKNYFSLFNSEGNIGDIETAERSMIRILRDELSYLAQKQLFTTILFIIIGTILLPRLNIGFTSSMLGMFRILCVGYALYAVANSIMLILLYFADNRGALVCAALFAVSSNAATWFLKFGRSQFYGFGLVIGGAVFSFAVYVRLNGYIKKLKYHVLSEQPVFATSYEGAITRFCDKMQRRAVKKQKSRKAFYDELIRQNEAK